VGPWRRKSNRLSAAHAGIHAGGRAEQIRCPTLVCSAENDDIGVTARKLHGALTGDKAFIAFTAREGAGEHCEAGARSLFNQRIFDWLDQVLADRD
jgi:hypothetical protein